MPKLVFCRVNKRWLLRHSPFERIERIMARRSRSARMTRDEFIAQACALARRISSGPFCEANVVRVLLRGGGQHYFRGRWTGNDLDRLLVQCAVEECQGEGRPYVADFAAEREAIRERRMRQAEREWAAAYNAGVEFRRMERKLKEMQREASKEHRAT